MRFKLDEPVRPFVINIILTIFWLFRLLVLASILLSLFVLVVFIADLVRTEMVYDFIRALFKGEETISLFWWLYLPLFWVFGWAVQKYLLPWVRHASSDELCDLFQRAKDYPVIETYLTGVSSDGRMISRKEYQCLVRMVKKDVKAKYWEMGKK